MREVEVHCAPGNPGISEDVTTHKIDLNSFSAICDLAKNLSPVTVIIGPEDPLIHGLADQLRSQNIAVFGPGSSAAKLEGSKAFSKSLMLKAKVPTAQFETFRDSKLAKEYASKLADRGYGVVVKASGNALGKGAIVCETLDIAYESIEKVLEERIFGSAGDEIVVEQRLMGKEFSLLTLVSDEHFISLPVVQDYKQAYQGNKGPNTGGMGGYTPVEWVSNDDVAQAEESIVAPILKQLQQMGINYRGLLFTGVMFDSGTPNCLEYNVRFGDPETQSVMMKLGSGFAESILACANGQSIPPMEVLPGATVTVVIASRGYPEAPEKGFPIKIDSSVLNDLQLNQNLSSPSSRSTNVKLFHAGTSLANGVLATSGGRVFGCSAYAANLPLARNAAYQLVKCIHFEGMQYRQDIAKLGHSK